jgi:hypothetical protein
MPMPPIVAPNLGLYLDRPSIALRPGALVDGFNFRVKAGRLHGNNLGWQKFSDDWTLGSRAMRIDNFFPRDLDEQLIFGDMTDLYVYDPDTDTVAYLTPQYDTGTASSANGAPGFSTVTGVGTDWDPEASVGDFIHFGAANYANPAGTWYEISARTNDTTLTIIGETGVIAAGAYTIRKVFHMSDTSEWDTEVFVNDGTSGDDLWIATNGVDPVVSWNGTDPTVTSHSSMNFVCQTLANFANMILYGNISTGGVSFPSSIINSDVGFPLAAGDDGTGLSDQFQIHEGSDEIVNIVPMGDLAVAYSRGHCTSIQFAGEDLVFIFRNAVNGLGPISLNAIADFGDFHEFIGPDAQYTFDGVSLSEVNEHVFRDILRTVDPIRRFRVYGHFDEENGDLIWSVPLTTDDEVGSVDGPPEQAYVEHYLEDAGEKLPTPFSRRAFPFTTTGFYAQAEGKTWADMTIAWEEVNYAWNDQFLQSAFPLNLAGDVTGQIYTLNTAQTGDGVVLPSYVRFGRRALGDGRQRSLLTRVYPFVEPNSTDLDIVIWLGDHAMGALSQKGNLTFDQTMPEGEHFVSVFRRGRFMELQFGSEDGTGWVLDGYDIDYVPGGLR